MSARDRASGGGQAGFTLVEVMVAMFVLAAGVLATVQGFATTKHTSVVANRQQTASHLAQAEVEKLRNVPYSNLALKSWPETTNDPNHPAIIPWGIFVWRAPSTWECLVHVGNVSTICQGAPGATPIVEGSERFEIGGDGDPATANAGAKRGWIYRYITWRDENCASALCNGTQNSKRIMVAVFFDAPPAGSAGGPTLAKPAWASSVAIDPKAADAVNVPPPQSTSIARTLYLYSSPCSDAYPGTPPAANHNPTHNTANWNKTSATGVGLFASPAGGVSACGNANDYNDAVSGTSERHRPDLMGGTPVSGSTTTPLRNYSADVARPASSQAGGLWLKQRAPASACSAAPVYTGDSDQARAATPGSASRWTTHAWSTKPINGSLRLRSGFKLSLHASALKALSGSAQICASLILRQSNTLFVSDTVLADGSNAVNQTCTPGSNGQAPLPAAFDAERPVNCTFKMTNTSRRALGIDGEPFWDATPDAGGDFRLVLLLTVASAPDNLGAAIAYDNPNFASYLQLTCDSNPSRCEL